MAVGGDCCVSEDQFEADRTQSTGSLDRRDRQQGLRARAPCDFSRRDFANGVIRELQLDCGATRAAEGGGGIESGERRCSCVGRGPSEPDTPRLERREEPRISRSRLSMVLRNKGNLVSASPAQAEGLAGRRRGRSRGVEDQAAQGAGPLRRHAVVHRRRRDADPSLSVQSSGQPRGRTARAHARKSRQDGGEGHVGLSDAQLHHSRQLPQTQRRIPATANPSL